MPSEKKKKYLSGNLDQMAFSLSGGGVRAVGFHLGRDFRDFFDDFYQFLPEVNILEQLLNRMSARQPPAPSGKRDMITAMANV